MLCCQVRRSFCSFELLEEKGGGEEGTESTLNDSSDRVHSANLLSRPGYGCGQILSSARSHVKIKLSSMHFDAQEEMRRRRGGLALDGPTYRAVAAAKNVTFS